MSTSDATGDAADFGEWIVDEFGNRGAFTALVILVEIGGQSVTPLASTYLNVIGTEVGWPEIVALFAGAGVPWDGASFFLVGGLLDDHAARAILRDIEAKVQADRLTLNEGFFVDRDGRRMMVERVAGQ